MRTNPPPATARNLSRDPARRTRSDGLRPHRLRSRAHSAALVAALTITQGTACALPVTRNVGEPSAGDAGPPTIAVEPLTPDSVYPAPGTPTSEIADPTADPRWALEFGYPGPVGTATAGALPGELAAALAACDVETLQAVLHSRFAVHHAPGWGTDLLGRYAAASWLVERDCLAEGRWLESEPPHTVLAPAAETLRGAVFPTDMVEAVFYSGGLGADGQGEARWTILRTEDARVGLGALELAPAGFSAETAVDTGATRNVRVTTRYRQAASLEIPVAWHSVQTRGAPALMTFLPYAYAYTDERISQGFAPGQTKIEFYDSDRDDRRTVEERIASSTWYEQAPRSTHVERITLDSGEMASLVRFEYEHAASTILFIETEAGVLTAPCFGDQGPCEEILKTVRLE